jgi:hypothetical protein
MQAQTPGFTADRFARASRWSVAAVAAVASAGLIGACGSSGSSTGSTTTTKTVHLNTAHVAVAIKQSILSQRHIHAKVTCPAVIVQEKGKNFVCIATTVNSKGAVQKTPFAVTQQNDHGYVTYQAE